jgi:hypothetical protein
MVPNGLSADATPGFSPSAYVSSVSKPATREEELAWKTPIVPFLAIMLDDDEPMGARLKAAEHILGYEIPCFTAL